MITQRQGCANGWPAVAMSSLALTRLVPAARIWRVSRQLSFVRLLTARQRWFTLGMGIKRWLLVLGVGAAVAGIGLAQFLFILYQSERLPERLSALVALQFLPPLFRVLLPLLLGGLLVLLALFRLVRNLLAPFRRPDERVSDSLYFHVQRNRGPQIVAIGGGTGMPGLLRGLKEYTSNITAVVTVADDGGSSGRLRRELGLLPPGDFRNNIAALARDETMMAQLMQYRFGGQVVTTPVNKRREEANGEGSPANGRGELQGHAFGNLLLAALAGISGGFDQALLAVERVLAMRGRVMPSTLENVILVADVLVPNAEKPEGVVERVIGESAIPLAGGRIKRVALEPAEVAAYPPVIQAILQADLIVLGPGSLYTSILPNLLVPGVAQALEIARAPKIYVCNLATQPGETDNYNVADHVAAILRHVPARCLDLILANDNLSVPATRGGGRTVYVAPIPPEGVPLQTADLVDEERPWRHDSSKLAKVVMELLPQISKRIV
jgi:uncharacterized cofD-like protein